MYIAKSTLTNSLPHLSPRNKNSGDIPQSNWSFCFFISRLPTSLFKPNEDFWLLELRKDARDSIIESDLTASYI
jgi:hypothetical protein